MKFKVVGESFNKYTEKDPEKRDSHTDDETPEHIYNQLFIQQINHSIMVENQILIEKLHATNKLLTDLYEEINGNYIETLGRDDELAIDCADAQLQLIKEIIDKVEKI